jgi:hypothetical protein
VTPSATVVSLGLATDGRRVRVTKYDSSINRNKLILNAA